MYRLLLVDDEALIREGVSENVQWKKYGYELAGSCENGKDALEFIQKHPVDVVMTDIGMPYMDGIQLSKRLSKDYPEIKIIILSGFDEFEYARKAISYGVKEYLLKPITAQELSKILTDLKKEMDKEQDSRKNISRMTAISHKGQQLLYSDVIYNLITGSWSEEENRRELSALGVSLNAGIYRAAIAQMDIGDKAENALMAFVLQNITHEIVKKYEAGEVCQGKDHRVLILFTSDKPVEFRRTVRQVCEEIISEMSRCAGIAVNIGIGGYREQMQDIYLSYEEAEEALDYHYVLGSNHISEIEEILTKKDRADFETIMNDLLLHIKENHSRKIEEDMTLLKNTLKDHMYDRRSAGTVLQRAADLVDEIRKLSDTDEVPDGLQKEGVLQKILSAGKLKDAVSILHTYCRETGEYLDSRKNIGGKKYVVLAMDYIEKNYADCDFNLPAICSYLNISPSRFSTIFKSSTGTTFLDVLNGIRMQKARELLAHTDMKNYEIAERVGFNDPHYFSIAFKKTTGKTPTEYAREMRN